MIKLKLSQINIKPTKLNLIFKITLIIITIFSNIELTAQCFNNATDIQYKYLPIQYMDSIPEAVSAKLWILNAIPNNSFRNFILLDESDEDINGKYIYQDINEYKEYFKKTNGYLPLGFIAFGYKDFIKNSNLRDYQNDSLHKQRISYYFDSNQNEKSEPNEEIDEVTLKLNYKFLLMLLHEASHSYQHLHIRKNFNRLTDEKNEDKAFILELNADYITGIFFATLIYSQLFEGYFKKKMNLSGSIIDAYPLEIDFKGIDKKYSFSISSRQTRTRKMQMFKKVGESIFMEIIKHGDFFIGQKKHHGTNADRATAFYNGYIDGLQKPFKDKKLREIILNDIEKRENNYNKFSEPWD